MQRSARREPVEESPETQLRTDGDVIRRRTLAFVADAILLGGAIFAVAGRVARSRVRQLLLGGASTVVLGLAYHILLEGRYGQTPGKKLFDVVVVREDGRPCTYTAATIRTFLRFVDGLPVAYLVGFASIALTERHQRLGDLFADTIVVQASRSETRD